MRGSPCGAADRVEKSTITPVSRSAREKGTFGRAIFSRSRSPLSAARVVRAWRRPRPSTLLVFAAARLEATPIRTPGGNGRMSRRRQRAHARCRAAFDALGLRSRRTSWPRPRPFPRGAHPFSWHPFLGDVSALLWNLRRRRRVRPRARCSRPRVSSQGLGVSLVTASQPKRPLSVQWVFMHSTMAVRPASFIPESVR
jgi:hypothetical protein